MYIPTYYLIIILIIAFNVALLTFKIKPYKSILKIAITFIKDHTYLLFLLFPLIVILNDKFVDKSEYEHAPIFNYLFNSEFLKKLSYVFVVTGSGIGVAKYLGNLHFFKKQIDRVLSSEKFKEVLSEKISEANFSHEYLSNLNNIDKKWKTLTLCKYQRKFPELMAEIEPLLENELFEENNLVCYYSKFRILVEIELLENEQDDKNGADDKIVKITEKNFFYVHPTSDDKVPLTFTISSIPDDGDERTYTKLDTANTKIDNVSLDELTEKDPNILKSPSQDNQKEGEWKSEDYTIFLEGKKKYYVERVVEMRQNLAIDRLSSLSSSKIIDHLNIEINTCEKTDIFFNPAGKNIFKQDGLKNKKNHYIKDSFTLPGDLYNIFIFRKDENS